MSRNRNTLGPLIGYHGCDRDTAERVLAGEDGLKKSENNYDWLGPGIYFWVDSPERAWEWAEEQKQRKKWKEAAVIGAFIHPGLSLNLTDFGVNEALIEAYEMLKASMETAKTKMPINDNQVEGVFLRRKLDCATINTLHQIREENKTPAYDTVYGVFEEGDELFTGSGFKKKTHVQIAVCSHDSIIGYFRVNK